MKYTKFYLSGLLWLLLACNANAGVYREIVFDPGESIVIFEGAVIQGERDSYVVEGQAGQTLGVRISSKENNAVFQIYGEVEGAWTPLIGADEGDDATVWENELPGGGSGRFKIIVGPTRGNAAYSLEIAIL